MAKPTAIRRIVQNGMIFLQGEDYNMGAKKQSGKRVKPLRPYGREPDPELQISNPKMRIPGQE